MSCEQETPETLSQWTPAKLVVAINRHQDIIEASMSLEEECHQVQRMQLLYDALEPKLQEERESVV